MTLSPQSVVYEVVSGGDAERDALGMVPHEVRFWESAQQQRDGLGKHRITAADGDRACYLMNSFLMQIRTNHQRIVRREDGALLHSDQSRGNIWVPPGVVENTEALGTFLTARNLPLGGYEPFRFLNYAGVEELLDGMWQHETYTLPLLGQVEANIEHYIPDAIRLGLEGDERGTTLNLQVIAGADDVFVECPKGDDPHTQNSLVDTTGTFVSMGSTAAGAGKRRSAGARFVSVALPNAATISVADVTFTGQFGEATSPELVVQAVDADDPPQTSNISAWNTSAFTSAAIQWDFSTTWTNNTEFPTPDIKTVIQELVDRAGWLTGKAMNITTLDDRDTDTDDRRSPYSYNGDTGKAPKFNVTFVSGPSSDEFFAAMQQPVEMLPIPTQVVGY